VAGAVVVVVARTVGVGIAAGPGGGTKREDVVVVVGGVREEKTAF